MCGGCVGGDATQRRVSCGIWSLFEMMSVIQEEAMRRAAADKVPHRDMTAPSTGTSPQNKKVKVSRDPPKVHISSPVGKYVQSGGIEKQIPTRKMKNSER